ncbi:hypothetical protein GCM10023189_10220 [Nibrella saemangeumensis]|uniref:Uncharacterized protein n=1 Tax=Nibrella saemangeumensis TaxID=1084526 RepID=A0ABP8MGB8_9BACT
MATHQEANNSVQSTLDTLRRGAQGDRQTGGIDQWQEILRSHDKTGDVSRSLDNLMKQLQQENPKAEEIQTQMEALAQELRLLSTRTDLGSNLHDQLGEMAVALRNASIQLNQHSDTNQPKAS